MYIEIDNSIEYILSYSCQIMFSVPFTWSPMSAGKYYYPDNIFSDYVVSASVTEYLWIVPTSINGVPFVKRNLFLLVFMIPNSTSDCFSLYVHCLFTLISTSIILSPCCILREAFIYLHILLVCYPFIREFSSFSPLKFTLCSLSYAIW